jgi:hypothetical protein
MNHTSHSNNKLFMQSSNSSPARARAGLVSRVLCASLLAGVCGVAALSLPAAASAAPTVSLKAAIKPVPGFAHTGNILGAGADLETEIGISGTEYAGGPLPIQEVKGYFPRGTKINTKGFTTCSGGALEMKGTAGCPAKSRAGKSSPTNGFVSLGGERVPETVQVSPFLVRGGGLDFWIEGNSPVKIEKLATGTWSFPSSGPVITVHVPLIETLPGAPDASATRIMTTLGGAQRKNGKVTYYGMVPRSCPRGGFPGKVEITFLGGVKATASTVVPCPPSGHKKHHH